MECVTAMMPHLWFAAVYLKWKDNQCNYSKQSYLNYRIVTICIWNSFESLSTCNFYNIQVPLQSSKALKSTKEPTTVLPKTSTISSGKQKINVFSYVSNDNIKPHGFILSFSPNLQLHASASLLLNELHFIKISKIW